MSRSTSFLVVWFLQGLSDCLSVRISACVQTPFDHVIGGVPSSALLHSHHARVPDLPNQFRDRARELSAAPGERNAAHGGNLGKPIKEGVSGTQRGPRPAPQDKILPSEAIVPSQPWIQLTVSRVLCSQVSPDNMAAARAANVWRESRANGS